MRSLLEFFNAIWPLCIDAGNQTGVHPEIIFAQAALETGYGAHHPQNNYFGIKGNGQPLTTTEFINGRAKLIVDSFAGYSDMGASVLGYARFISGNKRYKAFRAPGTIAIQLAALGQSGYATDPGYIGKLARIIDELPALEKQSRSFSARLRRGYSATRRLASLLKKPILGPPSPLASARQATNVTSNGENNVSDLSKFLDQHAKVLNVAANVINGLLDVAPIPAVAKTVVGDVVSALQQHATNTGTVAMGITQSPVATPAVEQPSIPQAPVEVDIMGTALEAALKEAEALLPQIIEDFAQDAAKSGIGVAVRDVVGEIERDGLFIAQAGVDGAVQVATKSPTSN